MFTSSSAVSTDVPIKNISSENLTNSFTIHEMYGLSIQETEEN